MFKQEFSWFGGFSVYEGIITMSDTVKRRRRIVGQMRKPRQEKRVAAREMPQSFDPANSMLCRKMQSYPFLASHRVPNGRLRASSHPDFPFHACVPRSTMTPRLRKKRPILLRVLCRAVFTVQLGRSSPSIEITPLSIAPFRISRLRNVAGSVAQDALIEMTPQHTHGHALLLDHSSEMSCRAAKVA